MNQYIYSIILLILPFIATGLGSSFVLFFKKTNPKLNQIFNGFAAGVMFSASVFGLILPSLETNVDYLPSYLVTTLGFILGILLIYLIDKLIPHFHLSSNSEEGIKTNKISRANKMFLAVTIHNIPEGLSVGVALGTALASFNNNGGDLFTILAPALMISLGIAIQNIPEGAVTVLPLKENFNSRNKAFLFGVMSGIVEPIAGIIGLFLAYYITPLMPWTLSLAAGCMVYVIVEDLIPSSMEENKNHFGLFSFVIGFLLMMILEGTLG